jgi:hypothetical protein
MWNGDDKRSMQNKKCKMKNLRITTEEVFLTGTYPASPTLEGGAEGHNVKKTPYREAPSFRARSFNRVIFGFWILDWVIPCGV